VRVCSGLGCMTCTVSSTVHACTLSLYHSCHLQPTGLLCMWQPECNG
jgi:hypothetical protein